MAQKIFAYSSDFGLLIIRLGLGLTFALGHGFLKLKGGTDNWTELGKNMALIGITFAPVFWGLCAALGEFLGGVCLLTGIFFRPACLVLCFIMIIAILSGLKQGSSFYDYAWPAEIFAVMLGLFFAGPGKYSLKLR